MENEDDLTKFEQLFEKLIKENKLDKQQLIKKLKQSFELQQNQATTIQGSNAILEEIENSQFNDVLLDEQILADDSQCDDDQQIATEAPHHQSQNTNNFYKFARN